MTYITSREDLLKSHVIICEEARHIMESKNCVSPETPVLTDTLQWIPIKEAAPGTVLVGFDEEALTNNTRRMFRPAIVEIISTVVRPSYKLSMEDGSVLIAAADHPWLVDAGKSSPIWRVTEDLRDSDDRYGATRIIKLLDVWKQDNSYEAGYLAAALDGEGFLSQKPNDAHGGGTCFTMGFAQKDNAMMTYVQSLFDQRGIEYHITPANGQKSCNNLAIHDLPRKDKIRLLGEIQPKRLISNLVLDLGMLFYYPKRVVHKEFLGNQELISIQTSTKTYVAAGFAAHNSDYGATTDGLRNFRLCENMMIPIDVGILTRLGDKLARIAKIVMTGDTVVKDETVQDTIVDMINYAVILSAALHERQVNSEEDLHKSPGPNPN